MVLSPPRNSIDCTALTQLHGRPVPLCSERQRCACHLRPVSTLRQQGVCCNRTEWLVGRSEARAMLARKWQCELASRFIAEPWVLGGDPVACRPKDKGFELTSATYAPPLVVATLGDESQSAFQFATRGAASRPIGRDAEEPVDLFEGESESQALRMGALLRANPQSGAKHLASNTPGCRPMGWRLSIHIQRRVSSWRRCANSLAIGQQTTTCANARRS